jgi:hypothetical protein
MRKSYLSLSVCALLASLTFVGCSNSSSTTPITSSSSGTLSLNPNLANIDYTCGELSGTTGSNGEYNYNYGDICSFVIAGKKLTATASSNLTIEKIAQENEGVSSDALAAFIIAKMSKKTGKIYNINNLPETFDLPDDIEDELSTSLDFSSMDTLLSGLSDDLKTRVEDMKYDIRSKFASKVDLRFQEINTPTLETAKITQQASNIVYVNGEEQNISYTTIMKTGDIDNNEIFGLSKDYLDENITFDDSSPYICNGTNSGVGSGLDYSSFLNKNGNLYMTLKLRYHI